MIPDSLLSPLQTALNRSIGTSTPARTLARDLDGRRVVIHSPDIGLNISFTFEEEVVQLTTAPIEGADCVITGSPLTLLRLAGDEPEAAFRDGSAEIKGDAEVGQAFRKFLRFARPDLEEELSRLIGDTAAHQLARGFKGFMAWGKKSSEAMALNTAEYLQEESRDLPSSAEAQHFMADVDTLREEADRLEARLRRLEKGTRS